MLTGEAYSSFEEGRMRLIEFFVGIYQLSEIKVVLEGIFFFLANSKKGMGYEIQLLILK